MLKTTGFSTAETKCRYVPSPLLAELVLRPGIVEYRFRRRAVQLVEGSPKTTHSRGVDRFQRRLTCTSFLSALTYTRVFDDRLETVRRNRSGRTDILYVPAGKLGATNRFGTRRARTPSGLVRVSKQKLNWLSETEMKNEP